MINSKQHGVQNSGPWDLWQASGYKKESLVYQQELYGAEFRTLGPMASIRLPPPPPCISYANVCNYYGPYTYCSLDKGVACAQHIQLPTHTCPCAWYECTLTSTYTSKSMQTQGSLANMKISGCSAWKPFLRSYTMQNNCTCSPLEDAFG